MKNLLSSNGVQDIIFVNNVKELKNLKGLEDKRLCIIKTDFKDLNEISNFCKTNSNMEIWLATREISRQNVINANMCGASNVIEYPVRKEIINDFVNKNNNNKLKDNIFSANDKYENIKGLKVMIVDDNPFNTDLLKEMLKSSGLNLSVYLKPKEAAAAAEQEKFDLFLLDIMMPDMSGYELAQIIQNSALNHNTPIIFISALSDAENKIKGFNLGSYIYIEKPFNVKVVKSQICSLIKSYSENKNRSKQLDSYLAMVTHDMKGPVQAELSALRLFLTNYSKNLSNEQIEIIQNVLNSTEYLEDMVINILNKFKYENGKIKINKQINSFKKLVTECCEQVKYTASERNIVINTSYKTKIDKIPFDYNEIKRVMHNLLTNAIKYSFKNSEIYVNIENNKTFLIVSMKNSSIGISQNNQNDVFDKFVSFAEQNKSVNIGLGLYISKQIISAHNGTISLESIPDKYTTVTFTLPLKNNK